MQSLKFTQDEGGPFTPENNRCQIVIPMSEGYTDMTRSYLELDVDLTFEASPVVYTGSMNLGRGGALQSQYTSSMMLKTTIWETQNQGVMEENKNINLFNQTMNKFVKGQQDIS